MKNYATKLLLKFLLILACSLLTAYVMDIAWNSILVEAVELPYIGFIGAVCVSLVLCSVLLPGFFFCMNEDLRAFAKDTVKYFIIYITVALCAILIAWIISFFAEPIVYPI